MTPLPFEIYEARARVNAAQYSRPCIVIALHRDGMMSIFPISTAMDLYKGPDLHFKIESSDPDFAKTGLTADSYIIGERLLEIEISSLLRKRGRLEGELLARFRTWFE